MTEFSLTLLGVGTVNIPGYSTMTLTKFTLYTDIHDEKKIKN